MRLAVYNKHNSGPNTELCGIPKQTDAVTKTIQNTSNCKESIITYNTSADRQRLKYDTRVRNLLSISCPHSFIIKLDLVFFLQKQKQQPNF